MQTFPFEPPQPQEAARPLASRKAAVPAFPAGAGLQAVPAPRDSFAKTDSFRREVPPLAPVRQQSKQRKKEALVFEDENLQVKTLTFEPMEKEGRIRVPMVMQFRNKQRSALPLLLPRFEVTKSTPGQPPITVNVKPAPGLALKSNLNLKTEPVQLAGQQVYELKYFVTLNEVRQYDLTLCLEYQ
jgi:hypothetical protein